MLSLEESLKILRETNALLEGHFILSSGLHSSKYVQCAQLMSKPQLASEICLSLSEKIQNEFKIDIYSVSSGLSSEGIDLGSRFVVPLEKQKTMMLIGTGVRAYEAGEVWHLLDQRVGMPITKIPIRNFNSIFSF